MKAIKINHSFLHNRLLLAAAYSHLGQGDDAAWEVTEVLTLNPEFSLERWAKGRPYQDPAQLGRLLDNLRKVGFP